MALLVAQTLLLTVGDSGLDGVAAVEAQAQNPATSYGKTVAINIADGRASARCSHDKPLAREQGSKPTCPLLPRDGWRPQEAVLLATQRLRNMQKTRQHEWAVEQPTPADFSIPLRQGCRIPLGRGRYASSLAEISRQRWKHVLWRTFEQIGEDRLLAVAAGVVCYGLLALFPAITALVSSYALIAEPKTMNDHLAALFGAGAWLFVGVWLKFGASAWLSAGFG
jgi:hypothetical protein